MSRETRRMIMAGCVIINAVLFVYGIVFLKNPLAAIFPLFWMLYCFVVGRY